MAIIKKPEWLSPRAQQLAAQIEELGGWHLDQQVDPNMDIFSELPPGSYRLPRNQRRQLIGELELARRELIDGLVEKYRAEVGYVPPEPPKSRLGFRNGQVKQENLLSE